MAEPPLARRRRSSQQLSLVLLCGLLAVACGQGWDQFSKDFASNKVKESEIDTAVGGGEMRYGDTTGWGIPRYDKPLGPQIKSDQVGIKGGSIEPQVAFQSPLVLDIDSKYDLSMRGKCDRIGDPKGVRIQRTMEYSWCKRMDLQTMTKKDGEVLERHLCERCRCEFAAYLDSVEPCAGTLECLLQLPGHFPGCEIPDVEFAKRVRMDINEWNWNMFEFCTDLDEFEVDGFTPLIDGWDFLTQRGWVKNPVSEGTADPRFGAWTERNAQDPLWEVFTTNYVEYIAPRYTLNPSDQPTKTGTGVAYYGKDEFTLGRFYCDKASPGSAPSVLLVALSLCLGAGLPRRLAAL